jgi:hypothetical protein
MSISTHFSETKEIIKKNRYSLNVWHTMRVYQKVSDWPPGVRTANGTALDH